MVELLDIPETITYSLSNVKLMLVTNNYFVEINEVIKGLMDDAGMPMMLLTLVLHNTNTPELAKTSLNLT